MGLNHIYKVIWSKTKNAWVVVSEIAKRDGKSSVKSVVTSLAGKSVAAVMVAMVMCGGVASANTVYGTGAAATGSNSTAIGDNSLASDSQATAIGNKAKATKSSAVAIGQDGITSTGTMFGSFIVNRTSIPSNGSEASGALAVAINGKATGDFSTAINGQVSGDHSIAIHGVADGNTAVAIGGNSYAAKDGAVAISGHALGMSSVSIKGNAAGNNSIAISGQASGVNSIAIGENSVTTGDKSVTLGTQNTIYGNESVSMGYSNYSSGSGAYIIGRNNGLSNPITAADSGIFGNNNQADNTGITGIRIIGNNNTVKSSNVMVMGNNVSVGTGLDGAVVLGHDSSTNNYYATPTNTTISGLTLDASKFYGTTTNGSTLTNGSIVSIGDANKERQIKNVAAGVISATSTDAVNGSQLYEAVRAVTAGASPDVYMHVNDGTGTQGAGNATTNLGKANEKGGATGNRSIAIGVGSQASGQNSVVIGSEVKSASDNIVAIGNPAAGSSSIGTNSMGATLIGYNSIISNNSASSSVFGSNSSVLGTSSVAINNASVNGTNSVAINGAAGRFLGINQFTSNNAVAINGVAKGNNNIAIGGSVGYSKVGDSYLVSGSNFSTPSENSIAIGNNTLVTQKNTVMVGTYDKEYTAKANTDKNKVITPALHTAYYTLGAVDKQYYEGTLNNSVYLGHESYAFTPDALVDDESHLTGEQSIHTKKYDSTGNIVVSNNTTGGAFGKVSKATINGDEITGFAGAQSVGAVTIGAGDYERRIQNVAAGEVSATSTDGINGSQLYAVADTLSKNMSSYMHINDGTSTQTVGNATTNYGYSGSKAGATGNLAIAGGMNAKASGQQSLSLGSYTKSEGDYSVVIGSSHDPSSWTSNGGRTFALGNYSVVLGRGAQTWKDNSIAIGHRAETLGEDSIAIGKYVYTGAYSSVPTERGSGITAVGIKLGVDGINTNVFGQGKMDNVGGGQPIQANDSTILGNRNKVNPIDSNGNIINLPSINEYATGNHILGNDSLTAGNNAIVIGNKSFAYQTLLH